MKKFISALLTLSLIFALTVPAFAAAPSSESTLSPTIISNNEAERTVTVDAAQDSETIIVYWYVDENGDTITSDVPPRKTAYGDAGTAALTFVDDFSVAWRITSKTNGPMVFVGAITTNHNDTYYLGSIEFDGTCSGVQDIRTTKGRNTATLTGYMVDANGVSITAPELSVTRYRTR